MNLKEILQNLNIKELNPMQQKMMDVATNNEDIMLLSPTGSGKTLGFLVHALQKIKSQNKGVQLLIIVPSRELGLQIEDVLKQMRTGWKTSFVYGGHDKKVEINSLAQAPEILIGTPGRLVFHLQNKNFDLNTVHTLVLDEFDKILEFGFEEQVSQLIASLSQLQKRILTSATSMDVLPKFIGNKPPKILNFLNENQSQPKIEFRKILCAPEEKVETLFKLICKVGNQRTLVFCNHREAVDRISKLLEEHRIYHETFHGGMEQDERERALLKFRNESVRILITTDLAARGLDIPEVASIIHYQLPPKEDAFVHRNGRTARMNAEGTAYLMMTEDENYPFLEKRITETSLEENYPLPVPTEFETLYISAGKKDKVNKVDIVGFLLKKGELDKNDVGRIEVKDYTSYAAIKRSKIKNALNKLSKEKLKGKKVKMEVAY